MLTSELLVNPFMAAKEDDALTGQPAGRIKGSQYSSRTDDNPRLPDGGPDIAVMLF